MTDTLNIAFIKARWHAEIVDQALIGFEGRIAASGIAARTTSFAVPGAFEMPLLAKKLGQSGKYDAVVCAALVVDGGIYRHDFVAQAVVDGLMTAQLETGVPTFSVSLTPHHFQPTAEHIDFFRDHFVKKGEEAADAVLMVAQLEVCSMSLPAFTFATATEIRFGRGEAGQAVPDLARLGKRVLLVHGRSAARADWLRAALLSEGCSVTGFAVATEPDLAMIEAGIALARDAGAQAVIALGGGAVIDAGKAIAALVPATRPVLDHLEVVGQGLPLDIAPLPFAALPTTAGTGAEVTRNAVIAVPEEQRKVSLRDRRMLPRMAIVDPALTDGCPRAVTLASGLDAVTQVIEPYICTRANPMTDALCRPVIGPGLAALITLMERDDAGARDRLAWTSLCGGLALANAGLGAVHGLAGPLGGLSGAPHGAICGVLLPHVLEANAGRASGAFAARIEDVRQMLAAVFATSEDSAFATLARWSRQAGLPGLDAQGVRGDHRKQAAIMAASSSSMKANPVLLDAEVLVEIMEQAR